MPLNVQTDYGKEIGEIYYIGKFLPLFILADKNGDVIIRWDGYSNADKFARKLNSSLKDLVTMREREEKEPSQRSVRDVNILASYYEDIKEYKKAVHFWRTGLGMKEKYRQTYLMKLFENYANGCWNDVYPFDSVTTAIDVLFNEPDFSQGDLVKAVRMTSNVARKTNNTDHIRQYLLDGIDITKNSKNPKVSRYSYLFGADFALYIKKDTALALNVRKKGFEIKSDYSAPTKNFYPFARYCFDRLINLEEAKQLLILVTERVDDGTYKAKVYSLLAKIAEHFDNRKEALQYVDMAMQNDPENDYYPEQYEELL